MKFWTIWTMPACTLTERLKRTRDWAAMEFGARLPLRVRYWITMLELGRATMQSANVPATTLEEILKHIDTPKSMS